MADYNLLLRREDTLKITLSHQKMARQIPKTSRKPSGVQILNLMLSMLLVAPIL